MLISTPGNSVEVRSLHSPLSIVEGGEPNGQREIYRLDLSRRLAKAGGLGRDGLVDEQIAQNIGIAASTLYEMEKAIPGDFRGLKRGKRAWTVRWKTLS